MRHDVAEFALEAIQQYYTSPTPRRRDVIPESSVQVHCALRLQQKNWIALTEVCWEAAVFTLAAAAEPASSALPGGDRIDLIAFSREQGSPLFAVEIKRDAKPEGLKKDLDRLSLLAAAWRPQRECKGILLLYYSFPTKNKLERQMLEFSTIFAKHEPVCTDLRSFSDPLNDGTYVHCAVGTCLAS